MVSRKTCVFHEKELLPLFCKKCEVLVCPECVETDHNQHEFVGVSSIVGTHKQCLETYLEKDTKDVAFKSLEQRVDKALSKLSEHSESARRQIVTEKRRLAKELDICETELLEKVSSLELKYGVPLRAMKVRLAHIQNITGQSEHLPDRQATLMDELDDMETVALSEDLKGVLSANTESFDFHTTSFKFHKAESNDDLEWKFGTVTEEEEALSDSGELVVEMSDTNDEDVFHDCDGLPEVLTGTQISKLSISNIISRSKESTLIRRDERLFAMNVINTDETLPVPSLISDNVLMVKRNCAGEICILQKKSRSSTVNTFQAVVSKMKPDGRIVKVCDLGSAHRCCIGFTNSGRTVAFLIHLNFRSKNTWSYKRQKIEIDRNGIITHSSEVTYSSSYPHDDVLGVSVLSDERSVVLFPKNVLVFDSSLKTTLVIYNGVQGIRPAVSFEARDMCLDIYGNILVADKGNNAVHVLDTKLKFIKYLLEEEDGVIAPVSLSFDNLGFLWIGCHDGKVFVLPYRTLYFSSK